MRIECKIEIMQVETKEIQVLINKQYVTDFELEDGKVNVFIWSEGNYSCDCNRHEYFHQIKENREVFEGDEIACSEGKYNIRITRLDTNEIIYNEFKE